VTYFQILFISNNINSRTMVQTTNVFSASPALHDVFNSTFNVSVSDGSLKITLITYSPEDAVHWIFNYQTAMNFVADMETQLTFNSNAVYPIFRMPPYNGKACNFRTDCGLMNMFKERVKDFTIQEEVNSFLSIQ
jgi:hypothetical protein